MHKTVNISYKHFLRFLQNIALGARKKILLPKPVTFFLLSSHQPPFFCFPYALTNLPKILGELYSVVRLPITATSQFLFM